MSVAPLPAGSDGSLYGRHLRRLMAQRNLTLRDVSRSCGVAISSVRGIIEETTRPHPRTLHKLATGLGVSVDELFAPLPALRVMQDDASQDAAARDFDRRTNPAVTAAIGAHPELFRDWTAGEFDELYSRVATGGELTEAGALTAAAAINDRRELLATVAMLLETDQAETLRETIAELTRRAQL